MTLSAPEASARAGRGEAVIGWKLDHDQRRELLQQFRPKFEKVIADHVTLVGHASSDAPLPEEREGEIVGRADDGRGVEAMVVAIAGATDRPDGSTYHITWSLAEGRRAEESNDLLADGTWVQFDLPMPIRLEPARFEKARVPA